MRVQKGLFPSSSSNQRHLLALVAPRKKNLFCVCVKMLCASMRHGFSISWIDSLTQAMKKFLSFPYNLHYFNGKFGLRKLAIHSIGKTNILASLKFMASILVRLNLISEVTRSTDSFKTKYVLRPKFGL